MFLHEDEHKRRNQIDKITKYFISVCAVLFFVSLPVSVYGIFRYLNQSVNPFGSYPVQDVVLDDVEVDIFYEGDTSVTVNAPVVDLDATVPVQATKCIEGSDEVAVVGYVQWKMIAPITRTYPPDEDVVKSTATRVPGCITPTFENPIPGFVEDAHKRYGPVTMWQIVGVECLENDSSVCVGWETENFVVDTSGG